MRHLLFTIALATLFCCCFAQNRRCLDGPFTDLRRAWDASHNLILLNGEYTKIYNISANQTGFLEPISFCVPNADAYPFPPASSQQIAAIIQRGTIRLCQPGSTINATTDPEDFAYTERILFYFNKHYNSSVTADFVVVNTSNDCFDALNRSEVDAVGPVFSIGVFIGNVRRTEVFAPACIHFVSIYVLGLSSNFSVKDFNEFRQLYILSTNLTASQKPRIATSGFGDYLTALAVFPGLNVTFFADEDIGAAFNNGQVDVLWNVFAVDLSTIHRPVEIILSDVPQPETTFFRYDTC
jgi:hypothetical protein